MEMEIVLLESFSVFLLHTLQLMSTGHCIFFLFQQNEWVHLVDSDRVTYYVLARNAAHLFRLRVSSSLLALSTADCE